MKIQLKHVKYLESLLAQGKQYLSVLNFYYY